MRFAGWLATVLLSIFSAQGRAGAAEWIECESCDAYTAASIAESRPAPAERVIFDASPKLLYKFEVHEELQGSGCSPEATQPINDDSAKANERKWGCLLRRVAVPVSVTSEELDLFQQLADYYLSEPVGWTKELRVTSTEMGADDYLGGVSQSNQLSGFDIANSARARTFLRTQALAHLSSLGVLGNGGGLVSQAAGIPLLGGNMDIVMIVTFSDGTTATIRFTESSPDGAINPSEVRVGPQLEAPTAQTVSQFAGQHELFSEQALENFFNQMERLGVPVTRAGSPGTSATCEFSCTSGTCELRCRRTLF
jgi:hypothetical protein